MGFARAYLAVFFICGLAGGQGLPAHLSLPTATVTAKTLAEAFQHYDVVLRPDTIAAEWWAGAPSVCLGEDGVFWMACRMRAGEGDRGLRGYALRILKSSDGIHFEPVLSIAREDVPIPGFERPALLRDPATGNFKLYACGPWQGGPWGIIKFDDAPTPAQFDPSTARLVIAPPQKTYERDAAVVEYKDPVIIVAGGVYHAYVIGYMRRNERIYHFTSADGEAWQPAGNPYDSLMPLSGWHDFFVRPSSVVPLGIGYLFVYEGSKTSWYDPVYNVATGLAFTADLHTLVDVTPDAPLLVSSTPSDTFATFRYSSWLIHDSQMWVYAEVTAPDNTHEIRVFRAPL